MSSQWHQSVHHWLKNSIVKYIIENPARWFLDLLRWILLYRMCFKSLLALIQPDFVVKVWSSTMARDGPREQTSSLWVSLGAAWSSGQFLPICMLNWSTVQSDLVIHHLLRCLRFDVGSGMATIRDPNPVKLGEFHTVELYRNHTLGYIIVDGGEPVNGSSQVAWLQLSALHMF